MGAHVKAAYTPGEQCAEDLSGGHDHPQWNTHVVGSPISHSLSPVIFDAAHVGVHCERAEVPRGALADFLRTDGKNDRGESVTMPLKKEAFQVCDWVDPQASAVGSINTLVIGDLTDSHGSSGSRGSSIPSSPCIPGSYIRGYNTDIEGIVQAIQESEETALLPRRRALILGSGATASSALAALQHLGFEEIAIAARRSSGEGTVFEVAEKLAQPIEYLPLSDVAAAIPRSDIVIATLPSGVADPLADELARAGADASSCSVLDAAYKHYPSALTQAVLSAGGKNIPGYEMLIHQGLAQAQLFTGRTPNSEAVHRAIRARIAQRRKHQAEARCRCNGDA